jgi:hypothetical protein
MLRAATYPAYRRSAATPASRRAKADEIASLLSADRTARKSSQALVAIASDAGGADSVTSVLSYFGPS